jgi:hypothetical protein
MSSPVAKHDKSNGFMDLPHGSWMVCRAYGVFNRLSALTVVTAQLHTSGLSHDAPQPHGSRGALGLAEPIELAPANYLVFKRL